MTACNVFIVVSKISLNVSSVRIATRLVIKVSLAVKSLVGRAKLSEANAPVARLAGAILTAFGSLCGLLVIWQSS